MAYAERRSPPYVGRSQSDVKGGARELTQNARGETTRQAGGQDLAKARWRLSRRRRAASDSAGRGETRTIEAPSERTRVALVTGASRGIGRAVALALAAEGVHIVALARTQGALEELDDAIRALRPGVEKPATLVPCDLKDYAAIDRLGEALFRRWGRLDVLVGNAGVLGPLSPLHHVDPSNGTT